jgi:hypothetical protein
LSPYCFFVTEIGRFLLFASQQAIRGISVEANPFDVTPPEAITPITSKDSHFVAVDYDASDDYIYYSDIKKGVIFRIHTNGTGAQFPRLTCLLNINDELKHTITNYLQRFTPFDITLAFETIF